MRVLVAGFQHETNTFARSPATYDSFVNGEGLPAMCRGDELFELEKINIPAGGFLAAMRAHGGTVVPVVWAAACPSGPVTREAYDRITGEILVAARAAQADAVYLDLHGAMVVEHVEDGDGELLARLRAVVGTEVPIVASLDLHANIGSRMLRAADGLVAYRTYPHVDMADTGRRAAELLLRVRAGATAHRVWRRIPFLIPVNAGCTYFEPASAVYGRLDELEGERSWLSFAAGFPAADVADCGPVVWGHGADRAALQDAVDQLYTDVVDREAAWTVRLLGPDEAVAEATRLARTAGGPVVIADTQDNPGGGGAADTTGMLKALANAGIDRAVLASVCDPAAAAAAHRAGVGSTLTVALGGRSGIPGDGPFEAAFVVEHLSDGRCRFAGPMLNGNELDVGPSACLRIGGVRVGVTTRKAQILDRNQLRMVGVQPEEQDVIVVKSSVHFRADFQPIASAVLVAVAPGPLAANPADLPWTRLRPGIRTSPLGKAFQPGG